MKMVNSVDPRYACMMHVRLEKMGAPGLDEEGGPVTTSDTLTVVDRKTREERVFGFSVCDGDIVFHEKEVEGSQLSFKQFVNVWFSRL